MTPIAQLARPLYVMAKAAGSACNMQCSYCYYLDKSKYYTTDSGSALLMDDELLELFIRQYIESSTAPQVLFTWHGGESLLRPIAFYEKVIKLQQKHARNIHIDNAIQTNGTLLNDDWARFFSEHGWLVGVSIDGPEEQHNHYRKMRNGFGSFQAVMRGIECLNRHGAEWNAMAVVNDHNSRSPIDFYNFFKRIDCRFIQFAPIVERLIPNGLAAPDTKIAPIAPWSVTPERWGEFLCALFDEWIKSDVGSIFVQIFDATLANYAGMEPGLCTLGRTCGHAAAIEYNGDLYSCDHFVFPQYLLGNIKHTHISALMGSSAQTDFGNAKQAALPQECKECKYLRLCNGECPKNRFRADRYGNTGLNYLCQGYKKYFEHTAPAMEYMLRALMDGRPAADVMGKKL